LIEFGLLVLEKILIFFSVFLLFRYYLPLEKDVPLHLNKLESPPPKNYLCQVWLKLAKWFWRRSKKNVKVYRQTDGKTDGRPDGRRTTGDQNSSLELSAQVS
jgi:hypothetical protein